MKDLVDSLEERLVAFWQQGDRLAVLDPAALAESAALRDQSPELADRIREVRTLLESVADSHGSAGVRSGVDGAQLRREQRAAGERRLELSREIDDLVSRARALPGLEDFLRRPSVDRLRAAADGPVVVVNTSALRCDALIVARDGLRTSAGSGTRWPAP